ncbi:MAG: hypothetical protein MUF23_15805 [Pirellula sp.]|jgi:hypothetical protein|nr:hypothetical protein [Pirellula sp.]
MKPVSLAIPMEHSFDPTSEAIIAIHAKLRVNQPKAFAVTIEKPGGVVVSTQEQLPLLAVVP